MRSKVTIVGAGNVGATTAQRIFDKGYADVVLVDIVEGLPQGKALDMLEAGPVVGSDATVLGTNGYEETAGSDIVVITSGIARKPGMSRDDLLLTNMKIVTSVVKEVVKHSPDCILLPVTNPLDAMAQRTFQVSGFPKSRVVGMAGVLDTARFRTFLAEELGVSVGVDLGVRARGSRRHDGAGRGQHYRRRAAGRGPAAAGASRSDRAAHPGRRRRDRRSAQDRQRLLRALGVHLADGRVDTPGQEAGAPPAPRTWRESTGSTESSSACRSSWGPRVSRRSSSSTSRRTSLPSCAGPPTP